MNRFFNMTVGLFLASVISLSAVQDAGASEVVVRLQDPPTIGTVVLLLFDSPNSFVGLREPIITKRVPLDDRNVYSLTNLPAGEYALVIYHDLNENERLDKNFIGIPREPLGFSNNYRPKGPPSYKSAAFNLAESETVTFDVRLARPLGRLGRVGAGIGVLARSSPYKDDDVIVYRVIPAITYIGERVQILGPRLQVGLAGSGSVRLAATASYRIGAYEEDDSPALEGLGDRHDTLMAGLALEYELPGGLDLTGRYEHDALGLIGGGEATLSLDKGFQVGKTRLTPSLGIHWLSKQMANHDFGVPSNKAIAERPAYRLSSTASFETGLGAFIELSESWSFIISARVEWLSDEITQSPIVSDQQVIKGFSALTYIF